LGPSFLAGEVLREHADVDFVCWKGFVREKVVVSAPEKRIDVFLAPDWGFAIERLQEEIRKCARLDGFRALGRSRGASRM
jgi:hypothetical protein